MAAATVRRPWAAARPLRKPGRSQRKSHRPLGPPFDPHQLPRAALIGFEASALIAFLSGAADNGGLLTQLLEGIAQGFWRGQISSLCLMRLLEGPLSQGHEGRAQSYRQVFADSQDLPVVAADGAVAEAAARLRWPQPCGTQPSKGRLSTGAALEVAAAIHAGAAVLVSDDWELQHGQALLPALDLPVVSSSCRPPSRPARSSA